MAKQRLIKNFFSLASVQVANYILPLIVLPYLARVIGVEKFGAVAFAQAVVAYFIMLSVFGFNLYGPREIAAAREEPERLRRVFWSIFYARIFLGLVALVLFALLLAAVPRFQAEILLLAFTFGYVVGDILLPLWFFQGVERMGYIALSHFAVRILYTAAVFTLIREPSHYVYVPLLHSLSQIMIGLAGVGVVLLTFKVAFRLPDLPEIRRVLSRSFVLFLSNISSGLYTKVPPILLGFFAGDLYVGFYAAAEKLYYAGIGLQGQVGQTLYPHISREAARNADRQKTLRLVHKAFLVTMAVAVPAALAAFLLSGPLIRLIYGPEFTGAAVVLKIFSFAFIIIGMSNVFGVQTLLTFNMAREYAFSILAGGAVSLVLGIILIPAFRHVGAALSYLLAECCVAAAMMAVLSSRGIGFFRGMRPAVLVEEMFSRKKKA
ncbi:MAG: flippase [Acidobacteriota bacterium]|nr:flippase [Acidobacteriota bacterium]